MDVRRFPLWEGRNATLLTNDLVRVVIEDQGGMVLELSNTSAQGGLVNAHALPWFRGTGMSVHYDDNHEFWQDNSLLYQRAGSYFCFPNFGAPCVVDGYEHDRDGFAANGYWMVERYGTDTQFGAAWLLSTISCRDSQHSWTIRKVDMLLPKHPVLYTSCTITNNESTPMVANVAWRNFLGSPFLESGCVLNSSANSWIASSLNDNGVASRILPGTPFDTLGSSPMADGLFADLNTVPGMVGATDFLAGSQAQESKLGWSTVINPRLQMLYCTFFPGPAAQEPTDLPLTDIHLLCDYGGRAMPPWSLYPGGTSQVFSLGCGAGTSYLDKGLSQSLSVTEAPLGPTCISLGAGQSKSVMYASAFAPFENPRIGSNIYSVEQVVEGLVFKRTRSYAFIEADSTFHALRTLTSKLVGNES